VFVVILITISINNIGRHLIDLLDAATKTEASKIRSSDKASRLGLPVVIMLVLHWRRKREAQWNPPKEEGEQGRIILQSGDSNHRR
jgi:hypothetical protein